MYDLNFGYSIRQCIDKDYAAMILKPYFTSNPMCIEINNKINAYLKNNKIRDDFTALGLEEAREVLAYDNMSDVEKKNYEASIKVRRIKDSEIQTALYKGERKGRAEGEKKGRAEGEQERLKLAKSLAEKDQSLAEKDQTIEESKKTIEEKDQSLAEKDKEIEELRKRLESLTK
jgi:hypothetical protein